MASAALTRQLAPVPSDMALSVLARFLRLVRTARHLRPVQFYGRAWFRLKPRRVPRRPAPVIRVRTADFVDHRWRASALRSAGRARFLGEEREFGGDRGWDDPEATKLWRYNLHYHDDLCAADAEAHVAQLLAHMEAWIRHNPVGDGSGWEPYPLSLRIVNWIKWDLRTGLLSGNADLRDSLAMQVRALCARIEWHLLGNHLFANAKALVFAGTYFSGPEADRWRVLGLGILQRELDEQILPDGGHFERSPMYQSIILEDVLDLANLERMAPTLFPERWRERVEDASRRMRRWLRIMTHPDGGIAFFNDATFGVAAEWAQLEVYAGALGMSADAVPLAVLEVLRDSGYVRLQSARAVVLCDIAAVGPDYQPAHAHADTLSFECSVDGIRCVVNGGTSTYAVGMQRDRERGTAAHSTVVIDGEDSSEVWGGFRVARRARAWIDVARVERGRVLVEGHHDGYRRLAGRVIHRRRWELSAGELVVHDMVEGLATSIRAVWLLSDQVDVQPAHPLPSPVELRTTVGTVLAWAASAGRTLLTDAAWAPGFGDVRVTRCLVIDEPGTAWTTSLRW